ncbi:hypothetical protein SO802_006023, partial [Lithocarpus litseifolius]
NQVQEWWTKQAWLWPCQLSLSRSEFFSNHWIIVSSEYQRLSLLSVKNTANANNNNNTNTNNPATTKAKRTRKSMPRDSPPQRSSIYRGVTRHRWTGRYEVHLWDKNCWNESQNKKGRQGAYDDEEAAAHAYDLAALKYWGHDTILNFQLSTYEEELKEMKSQSKEEYIGSLRRKSSGFSRGVSKYRGVARHHHNGRWEARIGRVFGNKYLYLGTYGNFMPTASSSASDTPQAPPPIRPDGVALASSALGLLLQSSKFKEMMERTSVIDNPSTPQELDPPRQTFPDDIQTYFDCQDSSSYTNGDDIIFGDINSFATPIFHYELEP